MHGSECKSHGGGGLTTKHNYDNNPVQLWTPTHTSSKFALKQILFCFGVFLCFIFASNIHKSFIRSWPYSSILVTNLHNINNYGRRLWSPITLAFCLVHFMNTRALSGSPLVYPTCWPLREMHENCPRLDHLIFFGSECCVYAPNLYMHQDLIFKNLLAERSGDLLQQLIETLQQGCSTVPLQRENGWFRQRLHNLRTAGTKSRLWTQLCYMYVLVLRQMHRCSSQTRGSAYIRTCTHAPGSLNGKPLGVETTH